MSVKKHKTDPFPLLLNDWKYYITWQLHVFWLFTPLLSSKHSPHWGVDHIPHISIVHSKPLSPVITNCSTSQNYIMWILIVSSIVQSEVVNPSPLVPGPFLVGLEITGLANGPCISQLHEHSLWIYRSIAATYCEVYWWNLLSSSYQHCQKVQK